MSRCFIVLFVVTLVLSSLLSGPSEGSEFRAFDPRALAMGGAGVASPSAAFAAYYNPGALANDPERIEIGFSIGVGARETGIAEHLQNILDLDVDWDDATENPQGAEAEAIINELVQIDMSDGIFVLPGGALAIKSGRFGIGVYPSAQIAIYADLDKVHINRTDPLADPLSFFYNDTSLFAQGLGLVEIPIAYAKQLQVGAGVLNVGGAIRFIQGITYDVEQKITTDLDLVQDTLENSDEISTSFGLDLGVQYVAPDGALTLGLVLRNLNSPGFSTVRGQEFSEDLQARAGVAYAFNKRWSAAMDLDVTANETLVGSHESQTIGGGVACQILSGIALRAGAKTNIAADGSDIIWSAGLSVGTENTCFELAAAIPSQWNDVDDYSFPSEATVILSLRGGW